MVECVRPDEDNGYDWLLPASMEDEDLEFEEVRKRVLADEYFSLDESWEEDDAEFGEEEEAAFRQEQMRLIEQRYAEAECNPRHVLNLIERGKAEPVDVLALLDKGMDPDEIWYELASCVRTRNA